MAKLFPSIRSFRTRSNEEEMMDDLEMGGTLIKQTLDQLEQINYWLGGLTVSKRSLKEMLLRLDLKDKNKSLRIADLGCGGGDSLRVMANWARKAGVKAEFIGIDANPNIIEYAIEKSSAYPELSFISLDVLSPKLDEYEFDIVICSLFLHHFDDEVIIELLRRIKKNTNYGLIINDLHRHWLAFYAFACVTWLAGASKMIRYDGMLSVQKGFRKSELLYLLESGGFRNKSVHWRWAFRFQCLCEVK